MSSARRRADAAASLVLIGVHLQSESESDLQSAMAKINNFGLFIDSTGMDMS